VLVHSTKMREMVAPGRTDHETAADDFRLRREFSSSNAPSIRPKAMGPRVISACAGNSLTPAKEHHHIRHSLMVLRTANGTAGRTARQLPASAMCLAFHKAATSVHSRPKPKINVSQWPIKQGPINGSDKSGVFCKQKRAAVALPCRAARPSAPQSLFARYARVIMGQWLPATQHCWQLRVLTIPGRVRPLQIVFPAPGKRCSWV